MTQHTHLDPSPFFLDGGPTGVLLIHGFTGAPPEMRLVGDYLHARGLTVSGPLLPGHGTSPADMNRCKWTDWTAHAAHALAELQSHCRTVFVGGLSVGAVSTKKLAARHPELAGALAYAPALWTADRKIYLSPLMKYLLPVRPVSSESDLVDPQADLRLWCYAETPVFAAHELLKLLMQVRRLLPQVTCPLLVLHSTGDRSIHPDSARLTYERAGAGDKQLVTIERSGHAITVDTQWEFVADTTYRFITAHTDAVT